MAQVSIIVPVYQVEKYIRKCIESIQAQTFSDFELILVDDAQRMHLEKFVMNTPRKMIG